MRLIDADELIVLAENTFSRPSGFIELIEETETAYNVEAVVAELESFSLDTTPYCNAMDENLCDGMSDCDFCKIQKAIDIVRKGGMHE